MPQPRGCALGCESEFGSVQVIRSRPEGGRIVTRHPYADVAVVAQATTDATNTCLPLGAAVMIVIYYKPLKGSLTADRAAVVLSVHGTRGHGDGRLTHLHWQGLPQPLSDPPATCTYTNQKDDSRVVAQGRYFWLLQTVSASPSRGCPEGKEPGEVAGQRVQVPAGILKPSQLQRVTGSEP
jgi:hypothetical protein